MWDIEFWKCYFHKFANLKQFTRDKLNDVECDLIMGGIAIVIKASKYWIRDWKWTIQDYVSNTRWAKYGKIIFTIRLKTIIPKTKI